MDALVRETGLASAQARRELRISQRLPVDQDYPWAVHTFGYGSNHDPAVLSEIAAAGKGVYSFIRHGDLVANAVSDCFGGLASSVALRVEVAIRPAIGCTLKVCFFLFVFNKSSNHGSSSLGSSHCVQNNGVR